MAKKKQPAKPTLELLTLDKHSLDMTDVLAVVTSRAETRLHSELSTAKGTLKVAQEELKTLESTKAKKTKSDEQAAGKTLADQIRPAIVAIGGTVTVKSDQWGSGNLDNDGNLTCVVAVANPNGDGCRNEVTFTARFKPSDELVRLDEQIEEGKKAVANAQSFALTAKKKLKNIPLLERRCRAKLAEAKLGETKDGQELLDVLTGDFEEDLLCLPGN